MAKNAIQHNFNYYTLMYNSPIQVIYNGRMYTFHLPSVKDAYADNFHPTFAGYIAVKVNQLLEHFNNKNPNIHCNNRLELVELLINHRTTDYTGFILYEKLRHYIEGFEVREDGHCYCGTAPLTPEVFDLYCYFVAVALRTEEFNLNKIVELDETDLSPEERAWREKERENQRKIDEARAKNAEGGGKGADIDKVILCVKRRFGFTMAEIEAMTPFSLIRFYKSSVFVDDYERQTAIYCNGHWTKKMGSIKHWSERNK